MQVSYQLEYVVIREILVKKDCPICDGAEYGCHDCDGKGHVKVWVSITEFINDMKTAIESREGIQ